MPDCVNRFLYFTVVLVYVMLVYMHHTKVCFTTGYGKSSDTIFIEFCQMMGS